MKTEKNEKTFLKKTIFSKILKMDKNLKFFKIRGKQTNYGFDNSKVKT